jgi:hypothetical protein
MKFTIQVLIESPDALPLSVPIRAIERSCDRIEDVGLRLEESKAILIGLQDQLVRQQLAEHLQRHRACPCCHRPRTIKGYHPLRFRSAFGDLKLRSPRWLRCACEDPTAPASYSALNELLTTHTSPELEFLQAKWAAHVSFAAVADLLHDVLPIDACLNDETIRMQVFKTAERLEAELGPEQFAFDTGSQHEIEESPEPGPPITVGLDGGYIRGRERRPGGTGCFEVIAGKSIPEEGTARGFSGTGPYECGMTKERILKELERVKWFLWHGNLFRADETLTDLMFEIDGAMEEDREAQRPAHVVLKKLERALEEFGTYIDNNASGIVNYGERHRCGERISTGFVESTINQLVARRFVKKQQMRWTPRGAHLLLQIRVQALNDDLRARFERWYPGLRQPQETKLAA